MDRDHRLPEMPSEDELQDEVWGDESPAQVPEPGDGAAGSIQPAAE